MVNEKFTKQFINGQWIKGSSEAVVEDYNPYSEEEITTISSADESDVNKAYQAAESAQKNWQKVAPAEKQAYFF